MTVTRVHDMLEDAARRFGDRAAIHVGDDAYSFRDLDRRSDSFARHLADRGVTRGARVALMSSNRVEFAVAVHASSKLGAAAVPGGSLPLLVGILAMFKVPGEAIAIVLGIDRVLDMARTTVNVVGDLTASAFIARSEGVWEPEAVSSG